MSQCSDRSPSGWYCILAEGHTTEHLSIDNTQQWEGSPGKPIWWGEATHALASAPKPVSTRPVSAPALDRVIEAQAAKHMGYTGIPCDMCGSPNTIRNGKCLMCMDCKSSGECG